MLIRQFCFEIPTAHLHVRLHLPSSYPPPSGSGMLFKTKSFKTRRTSCATESSSRSAISSRDVFNHESSRIPSCSSLFRLYGFEWSIENAEPTAICINREYSFTACISSLDRVDLRSSRSTAVASSIGFPIRFQTADRKSSSDRSSAD